jgi:type I restriction enzyme M protein
MSEMKVLHKSLLLACDLFRGKVDSSSYKDYIFSMLLLKYISDVKADYENDLINEEYSELLEIVSRVPEDASFIKYIMRLRIMVIILEKGLMIR